MEHLKLFWDIAEYAMLAFHILVWSRWLIRKLPKRAPKPSWKKSLPTLVPIPQRSVSIPTGGDSGDITILTGISEVIGAVYGDLWYNTTSNKLCMRMKDGSVAEVSTEDHYIECNNA